MRWAQCLDQYSYSNTLEIAIYVLKSANGGLLYTPLYVYKITLVTGVKTKQCERNLYM